MSCIFGMPSIVDKTCTPNVWHALCICRLTNCALVTNLPMWCMSCVAQVLNRITNPCATKKIHTTFLAFTCRKHVLTHMYAHICGKHCIIILAVKQTGHVHNIYVCNVAFE